MPISDLLTEDQVRDRAKEILGLEDTDSVRAGVGQLTTFNQLGFQGENRRPDGWYLPRDRSLPALIIEAKREGENINSFIDELLDNCRVAMRKYRKVIGIIYNGEDLLVYKNLEPIEVVPSLQNKEYYLGLFEINTIDVGDGIPIDDILETVHHFRAIDYVIDIAEDELTEDIIKHLHYILKHDTKDSTLEWFAVGDYKKRANVVGGRETSKPSDVHKHMMALLKEYNFKGNVTVEDIIALHTEFEYIHPFQDGNGRVGRLVALKECLRHSVIPFIIEDAKKNYYYRGLSEWRNEKGWLTDTCLDGQDTFKKLMDMLEIQY